LDGIVGGFLPRAGIGEMQNDQGNCRLAGASNSPADAVLIVTI
jgi:hypothetical protein